MRGARPFDPRRAGPPSVAGRRTLRTCQGTSLRLLGGVARGLRTCQGTSLRSWVARVAVRIPVACVGTCVAHVRSIPGGRTTVCRWEANVADVPRHVPTFLGSACGRPYSGDVCRDVRHARPFDPRRAGHPSVAGRHWCSRLPFGQKKCRLDRCLAPALVPRRILDRCAGECPPPPSFALLTYLEVFI